MTYPAYPAGAGEPVARDGRPDGARDRETEPWHALRVLVAAGLLVEDASDDPGHLRPLERRPSREQLEQDDPHRPDVGTGIDVPRRADLLR